MKINTPYISLFVSVAFTAAGVTTYQGVAQQPAAPQIRINAADQQTKQEKDEPKTEAAQGSPVSEPDARIVESGALSVPSPAASIADPRNGGEANLPVINQIILRELRAMPNGGGYAVNRKAVDGLKKAVVTDEKNANLAVTPNNAIPSFCSGATYLVFTKVLQNLRQSGQITITPASLKAYSEIGLPDGTGVWGRWNSNGPGTAKLFDEIGCGTNFSDIERALPGDFLKIWWNEEIGSKESGHSVIYLGRTIEKGNVSLRFWSSNIPGGYGEKSVPMSSAKRVLFSRLDKPKNLGDIAKLKRTNDFLSAMLKRPATWEEVVKECKVVIRTQVQRPVSPRLDAPPRAIPLQ